MKNITIAYRLSGKNVRPDGDRWFESRDGILFSVSIVPTESVAPGGFPIFDVVTSQGQAIGEVFKGSVTFERSSRGRRTVNSRWRGVRWFSTLPGESVRYWDEYTTRKSAVTKLIARALEDCVVIREELVR